MDGFDQSTNVKVIMATNRQDTLDPALMRPGRLDRKIEFPLPDRRQKRLVFQACTSKMSLADEVDLEDFVSRPEKISREDKRQRDKKNKKNRERERRRERETEEREAAATTSTRELGNLVAKLLSINWKIPIEIHLDILRQCRLIHRAGILLRFEPSIICSAMSYFHRCSKDLSVWKKCRCIRTMTLQQLQSCLFWPLKSGEDQRGSGKF